MKRLPIGIQTFSELITGNYTYVDKTGIAYDMVTQYKYVFLSRPRRFGKSLFVSTLDEIFKGNKELFNGLSIYDKWDWNKKHPVINISFTNTENSREELYQKTQQILTINAKNLGLEYDETKTEAVNFSNLIIDAYKKYGEQVVILIDEYDKPIIDRIDDKTEREWARGYLKSIYSVIKDSDKYIRFVFLTGVTKFNRVSLFSGLNNIEDISLNLNFGNVCGYTQHDLETVFAEHLHGADMKLVKEWYDGYNFLANDMYNPFDILLFIRNQFQYKNYWFESGTPSFLVKLLQERHYFIPDLENTVVSDNDLMTSFDIEDINIEILLYQSGYLTIIKTVTRGNKIKYEIGFPNIEVKMSFTDKLFLSMCKNNKEKELHQDTIYDALKNADFDSLKMQYSSLFAGIPYENYTNNNIQKYEGFYASVMYASLASLGIRMQTEVSTNKGRIDMLVQVENNQYIIEFKVGTADRLEQIKAQGYHERFTLSDKNLFIVGISFDETEKNITKFEYEQVCK